MKDFLICICDSELAVQQAIARRPGWTVVHRPTGATSGRMTQQDIVGTSPTTPPKVGDEKTIRNLPSEGSAFILILGR